MRMMLGGSSGTQKSSLELVAAIQDSALKGGEDLPS